MPHVTQRLHAGIILPEALRQSAALRRVFHLLISFAISALFILQGAAIAWIFLNYGGRP